MAEIELTSSQRTILTTLVNLYSDEETAIKGEAIADGVDRNPGTIRNQMQSLKALQLVEGVPGPKGGYKPTASAYEVLGLEQMDDPAEVPVHRDGDRVEGVNVTAIDLTNVHHPNLCRAEITLRGSIGEFHDGDSVRVGPTPLSNLVVEGVVAGRDESGNSLILEIREMRAPVDDSSY